MNLNLDIWIGNSFSSVFETIFYYGNAHNRLKDIMFGSMNDLLYELI